VKDQPAPKAGTPDVVCNRPALVGRDELHVAEAVTGGASRREQRSRYLGPMAGVPVQEGRAVILERNDRRHR
jgi:hypothetical protein